MKVVNHHIPSEILLAYACGSLPEAFGVVVASHISLCDTCRAEMASFDAIGGAVLKGTAPVEMSRDALAKTMQRVSSFDQPLMRKSPSDILPMPLAEYVGSDATKIKWRSVGGGVKQAVLDCSGPATARLLYIPAGKAVPDHGHSGLELTLVLQGAFSDEVSRFGSGDVEVGLPDLVHTPVADMGEDCICLAATDAPLKFNSIIPRIVQKFIGI